MMDESFHFYIDEASKMKSRLKQWISKAKEKWQQIERNNKPPQNNGQEKI